MRIRPSGGVKTTCGEVETRHILCNMNQNMVYAAMCPPEVVPERMVKLGNARTYSARMFVVYLGLDRSAEEIGIHDYTIFLPTSADSAKEYETGKCMETNCKPGHGLLQRCEPGVLTGGDVL